MDISSYKNLTKELLKLNNIFAIGDNMAKTYLYNLETSSGSILSEECKVAIVSHFYNSVNEVFFNDKYLNGLLSIYLKYFTNEELVQLIQFFSTPLGLKFSEINNSLNMIYTEIDSYTLSFYSEVENKISEKVLPTLEHYGVV